jgi:8-oxo-dGTP pyrophosphatase MutT (NUDIX family)
MEREISGGIIIFRRTPEGPRFLLLFRGYWNFPKGKLDMGEKAFRAALREVWEETGIRAKDLSFINFKVQDRYVFRSRQSGEKVYKTVSFYLAESNESRVRLSPEQQGYGWFLYREAMRILSVPNSKNNLRKAYAIITREKGPYIHRQNPKGQGSNLRPDSPQTREPRPRAIRGERPPEKQGPQNPMPPRDSRDRRYRRI